jgi:imidazolonepropionase
MESLLFKNIKQLIQIQEIGLTPIPGKMMAQLPMLEHAWLLVENGRIADYGEMSSCPALNIETIDASGKILMPSFVDCHTHIVFASSREEEFVMKIQGKSYEDIAAAGGGILNSATKLRASSAEELYQHASARLLQLMRLGTGAIEIKSGYGLNLESELKMLRVIKRLKANFDIPIKATLLAAHAIPEAYKNNRLAYIDLIINEIIPAVVKEDLAVFIDVFCEKGFFTVEETDRILKAGLAHGLRPKIHANQLAISGGVQVGVQNNAISVDHLEEIGEEELEVLSRSNTIPVALPSCSFYLGIPFTPARRILDYNLPLALASDYNPGSTPSGNMNFIFSLACIKMKLLPEEAIHAMTLNAACAMDVQKEVGSITRGKRANLILTKGIPSLAYLPYSFGENCIDNVFVKGKIMNFGFCTI